MTRFLSQALKAKEPEFRQGIDRLEHKTGRPSNDIRLTTEVLHQTRSKIDELGLNGSDTTPEELYHFLMHQVAQNDQKLVRKLRFDAAVNISADGDVVDGMVLHLNQLDDHKKVFALKSSSLKSILKLNPPKKAAKALGYRSQASMLKREKTETILAAAWLLEGPSWRNQLFNNYKKLSAKDFETRNLIIAAPSSKKWREIAQQEVDSRRNNLISLKEIGAVIILPLPKDIPAGTVTTSMALALHEMNMIRAASSYLKLCQVRKDFGKIVTKIASDEMELRGADLSHQNGWMLVQRYYHKFADELESEIFDPQLKAEDFKYHPVEHSLAKIEPSFGFWKDSSHLGMIHESNAVSMNLIDASINFCNGLDFENRFNEFFKQSLWNELLLRYLKRDKVEQTILNELQPKMALEEVGV